MRTTTYDASHPFVANEASLVRAPGRKINWALVPSSYIRGAVTVTTTAVADVNATSIAVVALTGPIPSGTTLYFGASKKLALMTAAAVTGATTITVQALPTALAEGDVATYGGSGKKILAAGTMVAAVSGLLVPRAASGSDTAIGLLEASTNEVDSAPGVSLLVGGVVFSNLLPDKDHGSFATWQGELEAAGIGTGWRWETYGDNTVS